MILNYRKLSNLLYFLQWIIKKLKQQVIILIYLYVALSLNYFELIEKRYTIDYLKFTINPVVNFIIYVAV